MAACGKIPFVNTFTVFLTSLGLLSARDQICYANLNVKFGGAYCGMSDALDGASHHATEDIAFMRALPNMKVIAPADAAAARWATKYAVENYGPMYLRLSREVYPDLYTEDTRFELGKGAIVRDGSDVTVIACGIMVHKALEAAKILEERLISVRVVDMYSIKPIDRELIVKCSGRDRRYRLRRGAQHPRRPRLCGFRSACVRRLRRSDRVCRHSGHVHGVRSLQGASRQIRP